MFAYSMLRGGRRSCRLKRFASSPPAKPRRQALRAHSDGTPLAPSQSGKHFSDSSFGHLGYTGTSLWCDPERDCAVILLTNRTWPDGHTQQIKRVRPLVHDAVIEALTLSRE